MIKEKWGVIKKSLKIYLETRRVLKGAKTINY
jgi:hypothetical protein